MKIKFRFEDKIMVQLQKVKELGNGRLKIGMKL